jgi:hypothetical protein
MLNLEKISDLHYKCPYGYFIFKKNESEWVFIPFEKEFNTEELMEVFGILKSLDNQK